VEKGGHSLSNDIMSADMFNLAVGRFPIFSNLIADLAIIALADAQVVADRSRRKTVSHRLFA
jgi:hypothetical protein